MDITPNTSPQKPAYPILLATVAAGVLLAQASAQEKQVLRGRRVPAEQLQVPAPGASMRKQVDDAKPQPKPTPGATPVSPEKRQERQRTLGKMRAREPKSPQKP